MTRGRNLIENWRETALRQHHGVSLNGFDIWATATESSPVPSALGSSPTPMEVVARGGPMRAVLEQLRTASGRREPTLIVGERGTGKAHLATATHRSQWAQAPFIVANCQRPQADAFGVESGARAIRRLLELWQMAQGGTLVVRQLQELPEGLRRQVLAHLVEASKGATGATPPWVVVAQSTDAERSPQGVTGELLGGGFMVCSRVPPLRERKVDIAPLTDFFRSTEEEGYRPLPRLSPEEEQALLAYRYPGNVRELRAMIHCWAQVRDSRPRCLLDWANWPRSAVLTAAELRGLERENAARALQVSNWKIAGPSGAAALLGMRPSTLAYRLKQLGLTRPRRDHRDGGSN